MVVSGTVRIRAVGAGVPAGRLDAAEVAAAWGERGKGRVAVCRDDEDVLTLGWQAADRALTAANQSPADVDGLWWGTSRPPYAEGPSHATLAAALGLSPTSGGALLSGSPHSGIEALLSAADAIAAGSSRLALVIVSDALLPQLGSALERRAGAGAAALLLSAADGPATLGRRTTRTEPVLDRYRGDRERDTRDTYDSRLFREETFLPMVSAVGADLTADGAPATWSAPDPDGRLGKTVGKRLGGTLGSAGVFEALGDTGAAAALLGALSSLTSPGDVGVIAFGGGRSTGLIVSVVSSVPGAADVDALLRTGQTMTYAEVLRARGQLVAGGETVPMGVPPGSAQFTRGSREMLQLLGARCVDCGVINTPPTIHPHCISCGGAKFTEVGLARTGTVQTFAVNHTMPAPFVAPLPLAVVDLDDGARVMLQVADNLELEVGTPVRLVLRRYAYERGAPVYGWKAARP